MKSKLIAVAMALLMSISVFAADNSIYIDQSGDNTNVTMTQDGAGNIVRGIQGVGSSNTTPAKIVGNDNTVSIQQIGSGNRLDFGINTTIANAAQQNGNVFNYRVTGNNGIAIINSNNDGQGTSASNYVDIDQTGNNSYTNINILGTNNKIVGVTDGGSNNSITSVISGESNVQNISMTGGGANQISTTQAGNAGNIDLTSVGAGNHYTIAQSGGSTNGHSAVVDINGSSNTVNITQQGTAGDSTINLKSVGTGNTFTLNSNVH